MKAFRMGLMAVLMLAGAGSASANEHAARVFFISPQDGATVGREVDVRMGAEGVTVEPAGAVHSHAGHHHLIIDGQPIPAGQVVPKDATHLHFGKGQTETRLKLTPGEHTLTLQFANGHHESYGPALSQTIHIKVQ